jgi:hypothetical protein
MENHFGKGLMAGLQASYADTAAHAANFCADYKRGFVLGYSHRMFEKTGDRQLSAWEAGILTRRYGLDRDMVMDFFKEVVPVPRCATLWRAIGWKANNRRRLPGGSEDVTPGAYLPFGCQSRGRRGAHAAAH